MNLDFPIDIVNLIDDFLNNRTFVVQIGNCRNHNHPIKEGLPQGAILSPILFNLYISEFQLKHASFGLYADDLVI